MYRLLRAAGPVRERRAQATHPARVRPELVADGPDQVWSWDITKLSGPVRGLYYDAYVSRLSQFLRGPRTSKKRISESESEMGLSTLN